MAPYTYYFMLSIVAVIAVLFHGVNMFLFKQKQITLTGEKFKKGSSQYDALSKLSTRRNLRIVAVALFLAVLNLIYSLYIFQDKAGVSGIVIPVLMLLLIIIVSLGIVLHINNRRRSMTGMDNSKKK